jgi:hypothetical protein
MNNSCGKGRDRVSPKMVTTDNTTADFAVALLTASLHLTKMRILRYKLKPIDIMNSCRRPSR